MARTEEILAERFARGEIDADELRERLDILRQGTGQEEKLTRCRSLAVPTHGSCCSAVTVRTFALLDQGCRLAQSQKSPLGSIRRG